jgi:hypothetical protein
MPRFLRTRPAPRVRGDYGAFRPFVRTDFERTCAYCLVHEIFAGGAAAFQLDHFRPRSRFKELVNDFFNLYYACYPCNLRKRDAWPSAELSERGVGFVDLCADNFEEHFEQRPDGTWSPLTPSAAYTVERIDLNRADLVTLRRLIVEARALGLFEGRRWLDVCL